MSMSLGLSWTSAVLDGDLDGAHSTQLEGPESNSGGKQPALKVDFYTPI